MAAECSAKIEKDELVIRIPINKSLPSSASGKTKTLATTHGFVKTGADYKGMSVSVSVNAFVKD